jgi:hypothetical protein
MKAKFFLAATLVLALAIGSANANPIKFEANKTTSANFHNNNGNSNKPVKHHRHHKKHRRHHVVIVKKH